MTRLNLGIALVFAIWSIVWTTMNEAANNEFNPRVIALIIIAALNLWFAWKFRKK